MRTGDRRWCAMTVLAAVRSRRSEPRHRLFLIDVVARERAPFHQVLAGHDAHNAPDDVVRADEIPAPQAVADHFDPRRASLVVLGAEVASLEWHRAENLQEIVRDAGADVAPGLTAGRDVDRDPLR